MDINSKNDINSYLIFKIGNEEFAASAGKVQRILELQPITTIPKAQVYMKGVINLMGKVLPVIDARIKMGLEEKEPDNNTCIIVLEVNKDGKLIETGIIVDSVQSVVEIEEHEIKSPPSLGKGVNADLIHGLIEQDNKFIMLLDVDNVFSADEIISISEASLVEIEEKDEKELLK